MKIKLVLWEVGSFIWVVLAGSALHFSFELSEFWTPLAFISAVNESVWEHLKMYFWPGLVFALVQYTYTRDIANNYWYAKLASLIATPVGIILSFYGYLAISIPLYGQGFFIMDLMTMVFGLVLASVVSYKIMVKAPMQLPRKKNILVGYLAITAMFSTFTFFPPKIFLFENYFGYEYSGDFGILEDYEPYRVFKKE